VAGINTLSARGRQAANYAIPVNRAQAFIDQALAPVDPVKDRAKLDVRLESFVKSLAAPKTVYSHIARYLSNACTASNAEYAISEVFDRAPRTVQQDIYETLDNPLYGMNYAVAWLIEDSLRGKKRGALHAGLGEITQNANGTYTVEIEVGDERTVSTTWVTEYGIWRLEKAGDLVNGDKTLAETKKKKAETDKNLRDDYSILLAAGYSYIVDGPPAALWAQVKRKTNAVTFGFNGFAGLAGKQLIQFDGVVGLEFSIKLKNLALLPFADVGVGMRLAHLAGVRISDDEDDMLIPGFGILGRAGIAITSSAAPGLFGVVSYQFNACEPMGVTFGPKASYEDMAKHFISIGIGYAF
jgi:hypothetical protein